MADCGPRRRALGIAQGTAVPRAGRGTEASTGGCHPRVAAVWSALLILCSSGSQADSREVQIRKPLELGQPWPLQCALVPVRGSPSPDQFKDRPVVVGSLVSWIDAPGPGFDEIDMRECEVPCVILKVPRNPPRQCVEQVPKP